MTKNNNKSDDDKTYDVNVMHNNQNRLPYFDKLNEEKTKLLQPIKQETNKKVSIIFNTNGAGNGATSTCNNPRCECNREKKTNVFNHFHTPMSQIMHNIMMNRHKNNIDSDDEFDRITLSSNKSNQSSNSSNDRRANKSDEFMNSGATTPSDKLLQKRTPTETHIQRILRNHQENVRTLASSSSDSSLSMNSDDIKYINGNVRRRFAPSSSSDDG